MPKQLFLSFSAAILQQQSLGRKRRNLLIRIMSSSATLCSQARLPLRSISKERDEQGPGGSAGSSCALAVLSAVCALQGSLIFREHGGSGIGVLLLLGGGDPQEQETRSSARTRLSQGFPVPAPGTGKGCLQVRSRHTNAAATSCTFSFSFVSGPRRQNNFALTIPCTER